MYTHPFEQRRNEVNNEANKGNCNFADIYGIGSNIVCDSKLDSGEICGKGN